MLGEVQGGSFKTSRAVLQRGRRWTETMVWRARRGDVLALERDEWKAWLERKIR